MSAPTLGAPIGPEILSPERRIVYDHVPELHELLANGGWPGVVYAQVCVHNVAEAAARAERPSNLRPIRGATYYSIQGPRGISDMALVGTGAPIPGAAPESGARLFFTDGEVAILTGWEVRYPIWLRPQPREEHGTREVEVTSRTDGAGQGQEGPARVEGRHAPQRKRPRAEGHESEAGGGDRAERGPAKPKRLMAGHTHPANFGRLVADCPRCQEIHAQKAG